MSNIEEKIKTLDSFKEKWQEKRREQIGLIFNRKSQIEPVEAKELKIKLKKIADELVEIGKNFHEEVLTIAKDIADDYRDNQIISNLINDIYNDVDSEWNVFHGNREERLRFLADVIEEFKKMFPRNRA